MKLVLMKDMKGKGAKGTIVEVADGYANSFLIPKQLARPATAGDLKSSQVAGEMKEQKQHQKQNHEEKLFFKTNKGTVVIKAKANEEGHLFASVDSVAIAKEAGINKENVVLKDNIKELGEYEVAIQIGPHKGHLIAKVEAE